MRARIVEIFLTRTRCFRQQVEAVAATEYAIMLALIVAVSIGTIGRIGAKFYNLYVMISDAVEGTM